LILSPEERLVLLLSGVSLSPGQIRTAQEILSPEGRVIDAAKLLRHADRNGVSPMLFRNMRKLSGLPESIVEGCRRGYYHTVSFNMRHARETLRLVEVLQGAGIGVIPLKGSIASDLIFGDAGLYPTSDIDLLVKPADLDAAREVLIRSGYALSEAKSEEDLLESSYHLIFHGATYTVELHWDLVMRYFAPCPDFWWENTVRVPYQGLVLTMLSSERYILYAMFRFYAHAFYPLKFLVFIEGLIEVDRGKTDWRLLADLARGCGMGRLLEFILTLLHDIHGVPMPEGFGNKRPRRFEFLKKTVLSALFVERPKLARRMVLYTAALQAPGGSFSVLVRSCFPAPSEIRLRYGLTPGSLKLPLYYLLNPWIMFFRKR
jgi:hypothetical protein